MAFLSSSPRDDEYDDYDITTQITRPMPMAIQVPLPPRLEARKQQPVPICPLCFWEFENNSMGSGPLDWNFEEYWLPDGGLDLSGEPQELCDEHQGKLLFADERDFATFVWVTQWVCQRYGSRPEHE